MRVLLGLVAFTVVPALTPAPGPPTPAATPNGAVVVRAVGDRDPASGAPEPVAGARVGVVTGDPGDPGAPAGACTTGADGTCTVAGLAPGPYRVVPIDDPPGSALHRIATIEPAGEGPVPYGVAVAVADATTTGATLAYRRANPAIAAGCRARVTLVHDLSGSIGPTEAAAMTAATLGFIDTLAGSAVRLGIASFATAAPAAGNTDRAPTPLADPAGVAAVRAAVVALVRPGGTDRYTNWDAALRTAVGHQDLVVLLTDGNPTVHGVPAVYPPVVTGRDQIEAAVASAGAVKAAGARVVAVGVGDPAQQSTTNLALVSGPVAGVDHFVTTAAGLAGVWRTLAAAICTPEPEPDPEPDPDPEPEPVPRFTG